MDNMNIPDKIHDIMNKTGGVHNVYHIETVDKKGNVVDEKFGVNLVTNLGTNQFLQYRGFGWQYVSSATVNNFFLFVGTGTTPPVETDTALESAALGRPVDRTWYYNDESSFYPAVYDPTTHMMSITMKLVRCYWDYNISGVTDTTRITEIGIGTSVTGLATRSLVYDAEGNLSYIDKHINERLYITAYLTFSMNMKVMDKLWDKGIYGFISPLMAYPEGARSDYSYGRCYCNYCFYRDPQQYADWFSTYGTDWGTFAGPSWSWYTREYYSGIDASTHLMTPNRSMQSDYTYDQYPGTQYISGMCFGKSHDAGTNSTDANGNVSDEISLYSFLEQPEVDAEAIEVNDFWFDDINTTFQLNNPDVIYPGKSFGKSSYRTGKSGHSGYYNNNGILPVTNFVTTALSMYNHLTHEWDIDEMSNFVTGTRNMKYEDVMWRRCGKLYVTINDQPKNVYVYSNPFNSYTIKSFNNTGLLIYATNEYWDTSTYQQVDLTNVQSELAHCKYYVVADGWNSTRLNPTFADDYVTGESTGYKPHRLLLQHQFKDLSTYMGDFGVNKSKRNYRYGLCRPCYSEENHWFAVSDVIVYTPDIYDPSTWVKWPISSIDPTAGNVVEKFYGFYTSRYNTSDRMVCVEYNSRYSGSTPAWFNKIRIYDLSTIDQLLSTDTIPVTDITLPTGETYNSYSIVSFSNVGPNEAYLLIQFTGRNEAYIIDVYNESYSLLPTSSQQAYVIAGTKYCVYYNNENGDPTQLTVVDMSDNSIFKTFNIGSRDTSSSYTINGIVGWNNYAYISYTSSANVNYIECYNIQTDSSTLIEDVAWAAFKPSLNYSRYLYGGIAYNNEVCVFTPATDKEIIFVTNDDPTNIRMLIPTDASKSTDYVNYWFSFPTLKYMNNGKQLILVGNGKPYDSADGNYRRIRVVDLGLAIDGGLAYLPLYNLPYSSENYPSSSQDDFVTGCQFPYGDGIIFQQYPYSGSNRLMWIPIEQMVQHKMTGTTTTINSYNNPFRLTMKPFMMTITNSLDLLLGMNE